MSKLKTIFTKIYDKNSWASSESRSGSGSELKNTQTVREELAHVLDKFNVKSMLDIPCGDMNWISNMDLSGIDYKGADIVKSLVEINSASYPALSFEVLDITESDLPAVDLIFARDVLGHFDNDNVVKAINNIVRSKSKYLLTTSFTRWSFNSNIENGGWRPINLMIEPFNLKPIYLINENCTEGNNQYNDKCLVMFEISRIFCGT